MPELGWKALAGHARDQGFELPPRLHQGRSAIRWPFPLHTTLPLPASAIGSADQPVKEHRTPPF